MTNPLPESAVELALNAALGLNTTVSDMLHHPDQHDREWKRHIVRTALTAALPAIREAVVGELAGLAADTARLDYIERTFSGMTNRERYLPVQMIWGKGCNGRTLREACDKYMTRDAAALTEQENRNG